MCSVILLPTPLQRSASSYRPISSNLFSFHCNRSAARYTAAECSTAADTLADQPDLYTPRNLADLPAGHTLAVAIVAVAVAAAAAAPVPEPLGKGQSYNQD